MALGPFTPTYTADPAIAGQLAEIGIILLMFGVGIHFSLAELASVRRIALLGAAIQGLCANPPGHRCRQSLGLGPRRRPRLRPLPLYRQHRRPAARPRRAQPAELFTVGVIATALGVAVGASSVFGVSLALGAFLAGVVLSESDISYQAAAEALPLRDAFAVLFFVSAGMLLDPSILLTSTGPIALVLAILLAANPLIAFVITITMGYPLRAALVVAAGLAQIGEFSFILSDMGRTLGPLPAQGQQIVLAAAIISISLNALLFRSLPWAEERLRRSPLAPMLIRRVDPGPQPEESDRLANHVVFCGFGAIGRIVARALDQRGFGYVVVEQDRRQVEELRRQGVPAYYGDATHPLLLDQVRLDYARALVVTISDPLVVRHIVAAAKKRREELDVVVTAPTASERVALEQLGAAEAVQADLETALEVTRHVLQRLSVDSRQLQWLLRGLRDHR